MTHAKPDLSILLSLLLIAGFVLVYATYSSPATSEASHLSPATGWAWSSNVGWISFNCANDSPPCANSDYKVHAEHLSATELNLRGWAWSSNVGWISFEPDYLAGCPLGPCAAKLSGTTVSGWAKVLSTNEFISLNCVTAPNGCTNSPYAVNYDPATGNLSGWAWGSGVTGWLSFSCSDTGACVASPYQVQIPPIPEQTCQDVKDPNFGKPVPCSTTGTTLPGGSGGGGGGMGTTTIKGKEIIPR